MLPVKNLARRICCGYRDRICGQAARILFVAERSLNDEWPKSSAANARGMENFDIETSKFIFTPFDTRRCFVKIGHMMRNFTEDPAA